MCERKKTARPCAQDECLILLALYFCWCVLSRTNIPLFRLAYSPSLLIPWARRRKLSAMRFCTSPWQSKQGRRRWFFCQSPLLPGRKMKMDLATWQALEVWAPASTSKAPSVVSTCTRCMRHSLSHGPQAKKYCSKRVRCQQCCRNPSSWPAYLGANSPDVLDYGNYSLQQLEPGRNENSAGIAGACADLGQLTAAL